MFSFLGLTRPQVENMTNKHAVFMTMDGRISMAGLSGAPLPPWGRRGAGPLCACGRLIADGLNLASPCTGAKCQYLAEAIKDSVENC